MLGYSRVCVSPLCVCNLSLQLQVPALPTLDWGPPPSDGNSAAASLPPLSGLSPGLAPAPSPVGEGPAATRVMPGWLRARPLVPLAYAGTVPLPLVGVWGPGSWGRSRQGRRGGAVSAPGDIPGPPGGSSGLHTAVWGHRMSRGS